LGCRLFRDNSIDDSLSIWAGHQVPIFVYLSVSIQAVKDLAGFSCLSVNVYVHAVAYFFFSKFGVNYSFTEILHAKRNCCFILSFNGELISYDANIGEQTSYPRASYLVTFRLHVKVGVGVWVWGLGKVRDRLRLRFGVISGLEHYL
jgi:hypothetical protein